MMQRKSAINHTKNLGVKAIDFKSISLRGRTGYVLCCLENTIAHQGLNHPRWQIILDLVWKGTESNYWFLESDFQGVSPEVILRYSNFASYTLKYPARTTLQDDYNAESEAEFNELRTIYEQSEVAKTLLICILEFACHPIYGAIDDEVILEYMDKIIHLMNVHSIPLPDVNLFTFSTPNAGTSDPLHGAPFTRADIFGPSV